MTITPIITKDPEAFTMTTTVELDVSAERAWQLWADPRQLERWWGPPTYPATVEEHDLVPGGRVSYFMTGPAGDKSNGWWRVLAVDEPKRLELKDGFADVNGKPDDSMPVTGMVVTFTERDGKTVMSIESQFPSLEAMERLIAMGMDEGLLAAMSQIEGVLTSS